MAHSFSELSSKFNRHFKNYFSVDNLFHQNRQYISVTEMPTYIFLQNTTMWLFLSEYFIFIYVSYSLGLNEIPYMWWKDYRSVKAALFDQIHVSNHGLDCPTQLTFHPLVFVFDSCISWQISKLQIWKNTAGKSAIYTPAAQN